MLRYPPNFVRPATSPSVTSLADEADLKQEQEREPEKHLKQKEEPEQKSEKEETPKESSGKAEEEVLEPVQPAEPKPERVRTLRNYQGKRIVELSYGIGDIITVVTKPTRKWHRGVLSKSETFPITGKAMFYQCDSAYVEEYHSDDEADDSSVQTGNKMLASTVGEI